MKDIALKYSKFSSFILSRYSNFDNGGDRDDWKSTSTYIFSIGSSVISWASKKQPITSLSTKEEAILITNQEAIQLSHLMNEIGYGKAYPYHISLDNQLAIALVKNLIFHQRIKHHYTLSSTFMFYDNRLIRYHNKPKEDP